MNKKKRVAIFGKTSLAIKTLDYFLERSEEYEVVVAVCVYPIPFYEDESFRDYAISKGIDVVESGNLEDIPNVMDDDWHVDYGISVFYHKLIGQWMIDKCGKVINTHFAMLPKYRGTRNINWALKNNEKFQGITIHEVTAGLDKGPIIAQMQFNIFPYFQEVIDIYKTAMKYAWVLFEDTFPNIDRISAVPQDDSKASYYSSKDNMRLEERFTFTKELSLKELKINQNNN